MGKRHQLGLVLCCFFGMQLLCSQTMPPYLRFDDHQKPRYEEALERLLDSLEPPLAQIDARIALAGRFKQQEDLIQVLEEKINRSGENARLCYLLGGAHGIRALEISRFRSLPHVRNMLYYFKRSIALDSTYIPAYEAAVEALCKVPSVIGGSVEEAQAYAQQLQAISPSAGLFSHAFILVQKGEAVAAAAAYKNAFQALEDDIEKEGDAAAYFNRFSMNFPYKIAVLSREQNQSFALGLQAIDYFIDQARPGYNLPLEWAYYHKGKLHQQLGEQDKALAAFDKSLSINPSFELLSNHSKSTQ